MATVNHALRGQRGLSLTEVTVVMILGTMIMAGIVGFYLSSQGVWLDASTQAITQREATLAMAAMSDSIRKSGMAKAYSPDPLHQQLALFRHSTDTVPFYNYWWNSTDSLLYSGTSVGGTGAGPMIVSHVERFKVVATGTAVRVDMRLRTASGDFVEAGVLAVMTNR